MTPHYLPSNNLWYQTEITLSRKSRGYHLITKEILSAIPEILSIQIGLLHLFLMHTSASLTINENADPDVRTDFETILNHIVPENLRGLKHTIEGPDDMPAHVKSSMMGASITLPVRQGRLALGTWQGIYLCEHRNHPSPRSITLTLNGVSSKISEQSQQQQ
jgi:secondary thiamine-phosphate synthase enzyme